MARTNINIDEGLIRKARKLTRLKTKREIVDRALELLVRSEDRKSILRYHTRAVVSGKATTRRPGEIAFDLGRYVCVGRLLQPFHGSIRK